MQNYRWVFLRITRSADVFHPTALMTRSASSASPVAHTPFVPWQACCTRSVCSHHTMTSRCTSRTSSFSAPIRSAGSRARISKRFSLRTYPTLPCTYSPAHPQRRHNVQIEFVGVWYVPHPSSPNSSHTSRRDTVCSVGLIPAQLPFTSSNYAIKTFRQALSLDEHRAKFLPNTWNTPTAREAALGFQPQATKRDSSLSKDDWEYEPPEEDQTDVLEVWFSGCHGGEC